jgi:CDP-diglyceride synthetase
MPEPAAPSKSRTFFRRAFSTLLLWGIFAIAFGSMKPWAHIALIALLAIWAMVEFCHLTRRSGIAIQRNFAILLSLAYSGVVSYFLLSGQKIPVELDLALLFILVAGSFIQRARRHLDHPRRAMANVDVFFHRSARLRPEP